MYAAPMRSADAAVRRAAREIVASLALLMLALATVPAHAEVAGGATGFSVKHEAFVPLAPAAAYAQALRVQEWWDPAHTYTGDAANLSLRAEPGGCWCEALPGGGFIEHMRLILAWPERLLRFDGALGPLQAMGVAGTLTFAFKAEGDGTRVTLTYTVGGHAPDDFAGVMKPVDGVLGAALKRFASRTTTRR